jgi:predicted RNA-binding protein with PUA-like domain
MNYWLMKSEPDVFSIDDLKKQPRRTTAWDGVRNYQARNMLRDQMRKGDLVLFYHSNCDEPGVVGIMEVVREGYPDATAFDPRDKHFDPGSDPDNPRWFVVNVKFRRKLRRNVSLAELRGHGALKDLQLLRRGNRLSVMPVSKKHWDYILSLE